MAKFTDNSAKILDKVRRAVDEAVSETAAAIASDAAILAPKRTGALSASYKNQKVNEAHEQVGSPLVYAPFVELGTVRQSAQPHLMPSFEINKDELPKKIRNKLND